MRQLPVIGSRFCLISWCRFTHYQKFSTGETSVYKYYQNLSRTVTLVVAP